MIFAFLVSTFVSYICCYFGYHFIMRSRNFKQFMRDKATTHIQKGLRLLEYRGGLMGISGYRHLSLNEQEIIQHILNAMITEISKPTTQNKILDMFEKTSTIQFFMQDSIRVVKNTGDLRRALDFIYQSFSDVWGAVANGKIEPWPLLEYGTTEEASYEQGHTTVHRYHVKFIIYVV